MSRKQTQRARSVSAIAQLAVWLFSVGGSGCGDPACDPSAAAERSLQVTVGIGERGSFQAIDDDQTLRLQRGCQGSQHIFTSLRVQGAAAGPLQVSVTVLRQADAAVVSTPFTLRLPAEPTDDPQVVQITGLTPVIEVPRDVLGKQVTIRAQVESSDGARGSDQLRGSVEWGLDSCGSHG